MKLKPLIPASVTGMMSKISTTAEDERNEMVT